MKCISIWEDTWKHKSLPSLKKEMEVDVLIIGGGLTGFSTLYELNKTKYKVALVERRTIGCGITSRSTAKINYLQGIVYSQIQKKLGYETAKGYLNSQLMGIKMLKDLITEHDISCDFKKVSSSLYGRDEDFMKLEEEFQFLKNEGIKIENKSNCLTVHDTYVFHPLKYLEALKDICSEHNSFIFENSLVTDIKKTDDGYICIVNQNPVKAHYVVLACHYPFKLFPFFLPIRTSIEKSYMMACVTNKCEDSTMITTYPTILSKRFYESDKKSFLITLSGSHTICNKIDCKENFRKLVQDNTPSYIWSNEDIMTADAMPFIGLIDKNLFLATGYNTWGMATSRLAGTIIKDLLIQKENPYIDLFDPKRTMGFLKIKKYPLYTLFNGKGFLENKIKKEKEWYPKDMCFSMINGKSVVKYKGNILYTTCPHMGCTLTFNEMEQTFDCPCHASRFDILGNVLTGPSLKSIKYEKED